MEACQYIKPHPSAHRSYYVQAGPQGRIYRRNDQHLMRTNETPHNIRQDIGPLPPAYVPRTPRHEQLQPQSTTRSGPPAPLQTDNDQSPEVRTRSGRLVQKPNWFKDYN